MDLSKAFDTLDHSILLTKLKYYGIQDNELMWFFSYLTNRQQYVESDGISSDLKPLFTGVPQGSILGPLLFKKIIWMTSHSLVNISNIFFTLTKRPYLLLFSFGQLHK